jgi:hypothetical protein
VTVMLVVSESGPVEDTTPVTPPSVACAPWREIVGVKLGVYAMVSDRRYVTTRVVCFGAG